MSILQFVNNKYTEEYSTSRGRWVKCLFDKGDSLMIIGETDDYFYFTLMLREGYLAHEYSVEISMDDEMYNPLVKLLEGFKLIEVLEEGTPEGKSLSFEKGEDCIHIVFHLTEEERAFYTIEFANLRRLGDTKFKNITFDEADLSDVCNPREEFIREFRYNFKVRLHNLLNELEEQCTSSQNQVK